MNTNTNSMSSTRTGFIVFLMAILIVSLVSVGLLSASPAAAESGEPEFARLSDLSGTLQVKGGYDDDWVAMEVNVPVGPGDSLWLERGGLAEVEFPGGSRIRMQGETKIDLYDFTALPASFVSKLETVEGRLYVRTPGRTRSGQSDPVEIRVPSARISIRPESLVRLDIESGRTRVRVQEGSVQIDPFGPGDPMPIFLGRMEQIRLELSAEPGFPGYFNTISEDGLERYNRYRDDRFYNNGSDERLEQTLVGQDELGRNGKWVLIGGINYWRPYVSISWRPYSVGHWAWYAGAGWMWISGDPFGYVTFHYGRWHHDGYYGWVWNPGYVFAPAHVHWVSTGSYYAWAPLGPHGHPITTGNIHFSLYSGFGIDLNVWSYAHVDYFVGIRHHRHHPKRHVHFKNPERRHFSQHKGKVVKARTIGSQSPSSKRNRQFAPSDDNSWRPYPNLSRQVENETRQTLQSLARKETRKRKTFLTDDRKTRGTQENTFRRNQPSPKKFSKPGRTTRPTPQLNRGPIKSPDRKITRGPKLSREQSPGATRELRKAPIVRQEKAMPPPNLEKRKAGTKQYRQAPNNNRGTFQKEESLRKAQKGSGTRGQSKGMKPQGSFKTGNMGKKGGNK